MGWESGNSGDTNAPGTGRLAAASRAPAKTEACADRKRQTGIADWRYVLIIQQVLTLSVNIHPGQHLETAAQIHFGVAVIQIAVGQKQTIAAESILALQIG